MTRAMLRDYIERWAPRAFVFATLLAILISLALCTLGTSTFRPRETSKAFLHHERNEEDYTMRTIAPGWRPTRTQVVAAVAALLSAPALAGETLDIRVRPHTNRRMRSNHSAIW